MYNIKPPLPDHRMNPFPVPWTSRIQTPIRRNNFGGMDNPTERPGYRMNVRRFRLRRIFSRSGRG